MSILNLHQDSTVVEAALPAHMMVLMMDECRKSGLEMRADVLEKLNVASVSPLSRLDTLSVARVARKVDDAARALLNDLSPDDPRDGLYCCAQFCLKLVDEGRISDPRNMAVLVALTLMEDVKDRTPDDAGQEAVWKVDEKRWYQKAGSIMLRANLQGLYLQFKCN